MFPRDKTCAGWITPAVVGSLGLDLDEYRRRGRVLQPIHGFRVARMGAAPLHNDHGPAPVSYAIRRCEFDHFLLARSGAELRTGTPLESLARDGRDWIVNGTLRTPLVIGAGGHFCPVARALGADLGRGEAVVGAQEFEVRMTPQQAERSPVRGDTPQLYFCPDLAGYAWVVRKGDWLNVGIGRRGPRELGEHMERFLAAMVRDGVLEPELARSRAKGHAYLLYPDAARPLVADGCAAGRRRRRPCLSGKRRRHPPGRRIRAARRRGDPRLQRAIHHGPPASLFGKDQEQIRRENEPGKCTGPQRQPAEAVRGFDAHAHALVHARVRHAALVPARARRAAARIAQPAKD